MWHDLARQGGNFGRVVVRAEDMQVIDVTHQGWTRAASLGDLSGGTTGQGHEFLRRRLRDRYAGDAGHFGRPLEGLGDERDDRQRDCRAAQRPDSRLNLNPRP